MTSKQYYAMKKRQERERIAQICREYPVEEVREAIKAGLSDEEAGKQFGIDATDFKRLKVFYSCLGKL